jgi:hypothetical protein
MKKALLITLFAIIFGSLVAQAQGSGSYAGVSQCWNGREWVTVRGNCPTTGGGGSSPGVDPNNGFYQLGYQFGNAIGQLFFGWLHTPSSNAADEALRQQQQQQMMAELRRRQEEAERQHREEEALRLAAMYNRLASTLKLVGLPHLQLKSSGTAVGGLQLKLGDNAQGYGIPGLPGIYTGGPGPGSGMTPQTPSKLKLKTGDDAMGTELASNATPAGQAPSDGQPGYGIPGLPGIYTGGPSSTPAATLPAQPGLHMKMGDSTAAPASPAAGVSDLGALDFNKMTPKQLADVADAFSKLPPEEQQRMMAAAQNPTAAPSQQANASPRDGWIAQQPSPAQSPSSSPVITPQTAAQPVASLQRQADASQAAAAAPVLEDASAKARAGFDTPVEAAAPPMVSSSMPSLLRSPGTPGASDRASAAPPASPSSAASMQASSPSQVSDDILFLFPSSQPNAPFPKAPNPPLTNPLREEQRVQAELKSWDNWAVQRATHLNDPPADPLYPVATLRATLNTSAVKQYAPELLDRYNSDAAFRQSVDQRLQYANEHVALEYYQLQADAHKAAILAFQAELDKLAAEGKIDKLTPLPDQLMQHPELKQVMKAARERVDANEQAALAKAQAEGLYKVDKEYQFAFQLIRGEAAPQH